MQEGEAADWASAIRQIARAKTPRTFGAYKDFKVNFETSFQSVDATAEARSQLMRLRQGALTADEYNTKFKSLIARAAFEKPNEHCEAYRRGLNSNLLRNIAQTGSIPDTLEKWYSIASKIDNAYRSIQLDMKEEPQKQGPPPMGKFSFPTRATTTPAPTQGTITTQAPRLARLTDEERERCIREKRCFRCRQQGHMTRECPNTGRFNIKPTIRATDITNPLETTNSCPTMSPDPPLPSAPTVTEAAATIRRLLAMMPEDQKDQIFSEMEKEGF